MTSARYIFAWEEKEHQMRLAEVHELRNRLDRLQDTYAQFADAVMDLNWAIAFQMFEAINDEAGMARCIERRKITT